MMQGSLAERLRVLRAQRGLTLVEAAENAGVGRDTLSDLERGRRHPVMPTLSKIAQGYGVPVEDLLDEPALAGKAEASEASGQPVTETTASDPLEYPEVQEWLRRQGHMNQGEFLSWVEEQESLEEVEDAVGELRRLRDKLLDDLKQTPVRDALFGPPRAEGLTGDAWVREVFRPNTLAHRVGNKLRSEYLAREVALSNYSRVLFIEGKAEDYLVHGPISEYAQERHQQILAARRALLKESYARGLAVVGS